MTHKSTLPYCYYDKYKKRVILKLITENNIKSVKIIYGDPFSYIKKGEKWEWQFNEATMTQQYIADNTMWYIELKPPLTRRLKYAFIVDGIYFSEKNIMKYDRTALNTPHNHFFFPFIHEVDAINAPKWAENICWYQIFPERFFNSDKNISPKIIEDWETGTPKQNNFFGGDLRGIIEKLSYLHDLGITGIYLTPIFLSPSNHKYDIQDYFTIDPHFGDINTLKELTNKAHSLGIKIMLDAVINHIGASHCFWQDVIKNQEKSLYKNYFHIRSFPVLEKYENREDINYDCFAFAQRMPKWNTENPQARKYLIDAALYWINECDIDAWRLDVSDEVSFNFWYELRQEIYKVKPDFYLLGELWHDPSKWLCGKYFDAVMNYPLGEIIRDMFVYDSIEPDIFNNRLVSSLMRFSDIHTKIQFNLLDSHDTSRVLTQAKEDYIKFKNAFLFMYLMKGSPCIYYGTETGMTGGNDPDCRKPMNWGYNKELIPFFKLLIAIRKEYNEIIQNANLEYVKNGDLCYWKLSSLELIYNAGTKTIEHKDNILIATAEKLFPKTMSLSVL